MRWAYHIKHKVKAASVLVIILGLILLGNIQATNSFSTLDNSISTIYRDRLQVSQYIYEISNALYQKRLLLDTENPKERGTVIALTQQYNNKIATLIQDYEQTVLTKEEAIQWGHFKQHLASYKTTEDKWIKSYAQNTDGNNNAVFSTAMQHEFNETIINLDALSKIQTGEGYALQKNSHSIVNNRLVFSYVEISMIIILGLFSLIILSVTDMNIFRQKQNQALN